MNIKNYKKIIEETAVYPTSVEDFGKMYTFLGLQGEFREMEIAANRYAYGRGADKTVAMLNLEKEIGDVVWYMTAMCKEFNLHIDDYYKIIKEKTPNPYYNNIEEVIEIAANTYDFSNLAEPFKKYYRDNKPIDMGLLNAALIFSANVIGELCACVGFNIDVILEKNYNKLIKRRETNTLHGDGDNREEASNG